MGHRQALSFWLTTFTDHRSKTSFFSAARAAVQLCAAVALAEPEMLADELFLLLEGARVAA
jgi:hypothetical protein